MDKLKKKFHAEMIEIYYSAKKIGHTPSYFLKMVTENGGHEAAKQLIHAHKTSEGFARLWELESLDLSVENHALKSEYRVLFTDEELEICRKRLKDHGYTPIEINPLH